ncbi:hypothetical protein EMIHUDRAFT_119904 [Emiliania huxleyi CCMP1516]|uniref:F-box domain-containing protein n=2 Tax=Emiliania huxleyi TaxID=2903 RepID=A0A0D3IPW9_EMIH1|nr:hypothetical protein EMIHUDRAFT_119904 [Emiliania huxleyi CCMP1516]EOD13304.1 hypothetical protein EMIHUDRAFT_119904 [Emiliania huxleyi CCMP1516]|eukprot:XP_005765733.1 hypothetical protein EMIHUDRAFT_119904 [Emiliania huxleyi CCMP1516]
MGASQSRPAPDACTASPLTPPPPPFPPPPSPSLLGLPAELLVCICSRLDIEALSSLASTSQELRDTIPDSLWQTHLDRLARAGGVAEEDVAAAGRRITNSIQRQAAIQAAAEAAEAAAFKSALTSLLASSDSCRLRVGLVRSMVCNLCQASGDALLPAISVSTDLATGRCLSCHTFGDLSAMAPSTDAFSIGLVQLWDLTPLSEHEAGAGGTAEIEQSSVLAARRADAVMLPFRTSVMMRVE